MKKLLDLTVAAHGGLEGLGDWRPQNGTFSVEIIE
jgi:hypothetical protein